MPDALHLQSSIPVREARVFDCGQSARHWRHFEGNACKTIPERRFAWARLERHGLWQGEQASDPAFWPRLLDRREPARPARRTDRTRLAKRIIACLDVRANDAGDLVVTKGDRYDVREAGTVRNLGKPVELARRY